jgi:hypothetical protein
VSARGRPRCSQCSRAQGCRARCSYPRWAAHGGLRSGHHPARARIAGAGSARVDDPRPWKRDGLGQQPGERRLVGGGAFEHALVQLAELPGTLPAARTFPAPLPSAGRGVRPTTPRGGGPRRDSLEPTPEDSSTDVRISVTKQAVFTLPGSTGRFARLSAPRVGDAGVVDTSERGLAFERIQAGLPDGPARLAGESQ